MSDNKPESTLNAVPPEAASHSTSANPQSSSTRYTSPTVEAQQTMRDAIATFSTVQEASNILSYRLLNQATSTVGKVVAPIADSPILKVIGKLPGLKRLAAALGQIEVPRLTKDIDQLKRDYPLETPSQLAHRIVVDTAAKAAGFGLASNLIPPLALTLFAVELAAIAQLQAEMLYKIAGVYGFPLQNSDRRGEVLAIYGLSIGGAGLLKTGLSFAEMIPGIGMVLGASSNAVLIYGLGRAACQYYDTKRELDPQEMV